MKMWLSRFSHRRTGWSNGVGLKDINPKFGSENDIDDLVLLTTEHLDIDQKVGGKWDRCDIFISREETSNLIDFLVNDQKTCDEVIEKVLLRLRAAATKNE